MRERIAVIDVGSNSARLIVMQIYNNNAYNLIYHQKDTIRLSEGIDHENMLKPDAIKRAISSLKTFSRMCQLFNTDKILAVATAAIRNASNGAAFLETIANETGIQLKTISGDTEAKLGYLGVINTLDVSDAILFDLGGGSTELTLIKNRKAEKIISLPFGAVTLTERFGLQNKASDHQIAELTKYINKEFAAIPWLNQQSVPLIGIGGTARNIARMDQKRKNYPFQKLHNYRMGSMSFNALWKDIAKTTYTQRRKIPGLSSERADIITAGLGVVKALFDTTKSSSLIVSSCGVREGLFIQYYMALTGQDEVTADTLMHSTHNMLAFCGGNIKHAYHVNALAENLFNSFKELFDLNERDKTLLQVAALLHDIGISINYYDHARHSSYLIENARLFGLTHREQMLTAVIGSWHHGPSVKYNHTKLYNEFLDEADWQKARKMALLLALAESLDTTQTSLVENIQTLIQEDTAYLKLTSKDTIAIELEAINKHCKWFKKETGLNLVVENL